MPQEEVKFFRDFFEYRKKYYNVDTKNKHWWDDMVDEGMELADKYADQPFHPFAIGCIVEHQKEVSARFYGQQEVGK